MRAVFVVGCKVSDSALQKALARKHWLPTAAQDEEAIVHHRNEILHTISDEDRHVAETFYKLTIYHEPTRTWGVISGVSQGTLTIRLLNHNAFYLQDACSQLVNALLKIPNGLLGPAISFESEIELRELKANRNSGAGTIYRGKLGKLWKDRRAEFVTSIILLFLFLLTAAYSFPSAPRLSSTPLGEVSPNTAQWLLEFAGRLASAFLVGVVTSAIALLAEWYRIGRGSSHIQWHTRPR